MQNYDGKGVSIENMDELYTAKEVCAMLKISRGTLHRYMKKGILRAIKFPGNGRFAPVRWDKKHIETFKRQNLFVPSTAA